MTAPRDLVLVSTHDLDVAAPLQGAFAAAGYDLTPVSDPRDLERVAGDPRLLLVTSLASAEGRRLATAASGAGLPVFGFFPEAATEGWRRVAREAGLTDAFVGRVDPGEVLVLGRRVIERRRLQEATGIVGETDAIAEVMERIVQIAPVNATVLVTGESGTGKELVARALHALSPRRHRPFIAVNVAALPDTLLESELFGHEKGAFTGAVDARKGLFELADRGTIFLDEIGEMPLATQTKLLRVLEQREFLRVGGERPIRVDVRIIAATNQELRQLVLVGDFRRDLYYRLNVLRIELPSLRDRRGDIPLLVRNFVREVSARHDRPFAGISDEAMQILMRHHWPGNVRELRNLVESMVILSPGRVIAPRDIPDEVRNPGAEVNLLPAPIPRGEGAAGALRPQLEFLFRTLVDLRMDVDQLRQQFQEYQRDGRSGAGGVPLAPLPTETSGRAVVWPEPMETLSGWPAEDETIPPVVEPRALAPPPAETEAPVEERVAPVESGDGVVVFRPGMTMEDLERQAIIVALGQVEGNRRRAAELLGIGERTLYRKIQSFGLDL